MQRDWADTRSIERISCFAICYGCGATSEISIENLRFCSNGVSLTQNFRYESRPTNHSSCRKPD